MSVESIVGSGAGVERGVDAPHAALDEILGPIGRLRAYRGGEFVYREGDEGTSLHMVMSGRFATEVATFGVGTVILGIHGPGELLGEIARDSTEELRPHGLIALEAGSVLTMLRREFLTLRDDHPGLSMLLAVLLEKRLREATARIARLSQAPAAIRTLRILAALERTYRDGDAPTTIALSQHQIAAMASTSRDTVNRVLAKAERERWLRVERQRIVVLDAAELHRRAE